MDKIRVFISYSHENEIWLTEWLDPVLQTVNPRCLLKQWQRTFRNENVEFWFDRERDKGLRGGERWRERIFKEIDKADIALLLVTQQFVISPFIMDEELPHILTRHKKHEMEVLPLLVQPTRLKDLPTGDFLQWAPGKPTPLSSYFDRGDNAFAEACNEVLDALEQTIVRVREKRNQTALASTQSSQKKEADIELNGINPGKKNIANNLEVSTKEKGQTLQISSEGSSPEPYNPIVGVLIKDLTGAETKLTEFGIGLDNLERAVRDYLNIERGNGSMKIFWNRIESVVVHSREDIMIQFRDGNSMDHVKPSFGRLVGIDESGFTVAFEFANLQSITLLRDTSVPEREALIRDIPILAKRTLLNSSYTCTCQLEPDKEGILVTLDVFFQNKLATNGHKTFRLPDHHIFSASGESVSITIMSKGLINLGRYDPRTAFALAQALNRLNALLFEEISGTNDGAVSQHSNVLSQLTEKQAISEDRLAVAVNQTSAQKETFSIIEIPHSLMVAPAGIEFVFVKGGTFQMGKSFAGDSSDQKPVHTVTLSDFYLGKTEVTVAQYRTFCNATAKKMPSQPKWGWEDNYPIVSISWKDAIDFCKWAGCRLPTEAEWEYAAKGGSQSKGYIYSGSNNIDDVACYGSPKPLPVATKKSNELGIYDMSGNAWEFCSDCFSDYSSDAQINPLGPENSKWGHREHVMRGGTFSSGSHEIGPRSDCYPSYRSYVGDWIHQCYGFRCAKTP